MDLDAGLSGVPVVFDGPSPRRRTGSAGSASDGLGPAFAMDFEDPEARRRRPVGAFTPRDGVSGREDGWSLFLLKGPFGPMSS